MKGTKPKDDEYVKATIDLAVSGNWLTVSLPLAKARALLKNLKETGNNVEFDPDWLCISGGWDEILNQLEFEVESIEFEGGDVDE